MGEGKVRCCGSNLFLKSKFGGGYKLTIEKSQGFETQRVLEFINNYSKASLKEENDVKVEIELSKENLAN